MIVNSNPVLGLRFVGFIGLGFTGFEGFKGFRSSGFRDFSLKV